MLTDDRGKNNAPPGPSTKTTEPPNREQSMESISDEPDEDEPAIKKKATEKRGTKEISTIEARMEDRLSKLEKRMETKIEQMFESIKAAIAEKSRIDHERFLRIQRAIQQIPNFNAFTQDQAPRAAAQEVIVRADRSWPQTLQ